MTAAAGSQPVSSAELSATVADRLGKRLPPGWSAVALHRSRPGGAWSPDAFLEVAAPDGTRATFALWVQRHLVTRDLPGLMDRITTSGADPSSPVVVSPYLSSAVRTWLEETGVSYADATGNLSLTGDGPALYVRDRGADRDPWRGPGRPRGTLRGVPAARVVRALVDHRPPLTVTGLVELAGSSTGATYRVLDFLEQESLVIRGRRGVVEDVRWRALIERWSGEYSFQSDNTVVRFLQPRGTAAVTAALAKTADRSSYALTGSLAAARWAPYAPARLATVYVRDVARAAAEWGLREVDAGANVLLAVPASDVPFQRTTEVDGVTCCAPSQVAVDLLGGPGRNPAEGQALIEWMESDETAWRS